MKVVEFKKKVSEEALKCAKDLLARVKAGDITAIAWIGHGNTAEDGSTHAICGYNDYYLMLGEIERLRHRIHKAMDDEMIVPSQITSEGSDDDDNV